MAFRLKPDLHHLPEQLIWVVVLGSAVAIGGVHTPVIVGLGLLVLALWGLVTWGRKRDALGGAALLIWGLLLAGCWSLLLTLPLGPLVGLFSPDVAELWRGAQYTPSFSANLSATRAAAVKCLAGAALVWAAAVWFRRPGRVALLVDAIVGTATAIALMGLVQGALDVERLLFVYEPRMGPVHDGLRGPFVNPDHYGAYLAVAAVMALGEGLALQDNRRRYIYFLAAVVLVAGLFLSLSLSALVGFVAGLVGLVFFWVRKPASLADLLRLLAPLVLVGALLAWAGLALGLAGDPVAAVEEQWKSLTGLAGVWAAVAGVWANAPLVGIGSGSLADLLARRLDPPAVSIWFARNEGLQVLVDYGAVVGGVLLVGVVAATRPIARRPSSERVQIMLPALAGLCGLVAISLVDFAVELPALGIVGALLVGAVWSDPTGTGSTSARRGRLSRALQARPARWALIVTMLLSSGWALSTWIGHARAWDVLSRVTDEERAPSPSAVVDAGRRALQVRPGWGRVHALVGRSLVLGGQAETALRWLERAAELTPGEASTLRLLGLAYLRVGRVDEAVSVLESTLDERDPEGTEQTLRLVSRATDDVRLWHAVAATEAAARDLVEVLLFERRSLDALRFASELLSARSDDALGLEAGARAALALDVPQLAAYYTDRLERRVGDSAQVSLLQSHVDRSRGELQTALERLERALERYPDDPELLLGLGDVLVALGERGEAPPDLSARMHDLRQRLRPLALPDPRLASDFHALSARFYYLSAQWRAAVSAARLGIATESARADLYELMGLALLELEDREGAEAALGRALALDPSRLRTALALSQARGGADAALDGVDGAPPGTGSGTGSGMSVPEPSQATTEASE